MVNRTGFTNGCTEREDMGNKSILGGLAVIVLLVGASCSGGRSPLNLGVTEGRLTPCPGSPNCVSSQATDADRRVEPLRYADDFAEARARLLEILRGMERVQIQRADDDYLHAEFRSAVFGFVDDVEFYFSPPGVIQVRSASRTGYYDFGVNRNRVERIHQIWRTNRSPASGG